jgi:putative tryptophan/tyrosine transport system substrate-binding protein
MKKILRSCFIALLGSAAIAWSLAAYAQQPAMPVIGYLGSGSPDLDSHRVRAFREGLSEAGYVEGRNVAIEFRWAQGQSDRLPALAAELVRRQVTVVIAGSGTRSALLLKAATTTIPIVFQVAVDPVEVGLVASLSRPGGNLTGVASLNVETEAKRLEMLHELIPTANIVALLVNPTSPFADAITKEAQAAARILGLQLHVVRAGSEREFDPAFATMVQLRAGAAAISTDSFYLNRPDPLAAATVRHAVPTISPYREFTAAGGLMSYGTDVADSFRQVGVYAGRILNGEKPADLPVQQATKLALTLNLKTAKALGLTLPLTLLGRADGIIE